MRINAFTFQKCKEIKDGNVTAIETDTTIVVEPIKIKTTYYIKEKINESNTNEH